MEHDFILDQMQIEATPFALCELNGKGDLGLGQDSTATLHYILSGRGEIRIPGQLNLPVSRGTLVLVPALRSHVLHSYGEDIDPLPQCRPAGLNLVHLVHKQDGRDLHGGLVAICAHINLSLKNLNNIIDLVRDPIIDTVADNPGLAVPVTQILQEIACPALGSKAMLRALIQQAMIALMRHKLQRDDSDLAWMQALRDPRLWPVLTHMMHSPGGDHSLETLAEQAGMSRSTLAQRFSDAYGSGPMELLRELRMQRAADLLAQSDMPVKRISAEVGFKSRTAFSRAFEATTGQSPRSYRREKKARS
ncbi:helix-turn-helix domain-containing protein [Parasedimentitalea maritima]|uniref:Helix-turn-helix domain-containing protein n=1 Tax=Parasedimentitalea maritima TaxID=2578117 RepID=A0A6A4REE4_9RHOB|nr:AraC family transcriptional regulator [Zongyanglinia marina]KAE9628273.1 helix-turn-helix domain-containing protein [Zongyanglinia marina]